MYNLNFKIEGGFQFAWLKINEQSELDKKLTLFNFNKDNKAIQLYYDKPTLVFTHKLGESINSIKIENFPIQLKRAYMLSVNWDTVKKIYQISVNGILQKTTDNPDSNFDIIDENFTTHSREKLFLAILKDLKLKIQTKDEYNLLKASELIRSLLYDSSKPLLHKVNRTYKCKILFEFCELPNNSFLTEYLKNDGYLFIGRQINPDNIIMHGLSKQTGSLSSFEKSKVIITNDKSYSLHDVWKFIWYKLGGVHHEDDIDEKFQELQHFSTYGKNSMIDLIIPTGKIILKALEELEKTIYNNVYKT